jgi:cytidylate kinase|tara:strand:+ start:45 stop:641 length:597 start_codon:yes stop_codon:yes gene_type:complete
MAPHCYAVRYVATNGDENILKVSISGHPGSGTTTLVNSICKLMSWTTVNGGDIFRNQAKDRGISLAEFSEICRSDESIDRMLDAMLIEFMEAEDGPEIVESRLAGWWAYRQNISCVRIWLEVSDEERAHRVSSREGLSMEEALSANKKRLLVDRQRYESMYGIRPSDATPYTHTIDATTLSKEEVLKVALKILKEEEK